MPRGANFYKHGGKGTPTYKIWKSMRQRCNVPSASAYHKYGGRGIKVCERWDWYPNFLADMGERPDGYSIERVDNDGPYSPENCKWIPIEEQAANKRNTRRITIDGVTKHLAEWTRLSPVTEHAIRVRIRRGWSPHDAVFTPAYRKPNNAKV